MIVLILLACRRDCVIVGTKCEEQGKFDCTCERMLASCSEEHVWTAGTVSCDCVNEEGDIPDTAECSEHLGAYD